MKNIQKNTMPPGFTLIELLIVMAISTIIVAAVYSAYVTQNKIYNSQEAVAEMQQNLRAGLVALTRDIRMSGYDLLATADSGFVDNVSFSDGATPTPQTETVFSSSTQIAFTADLDGDGTIDVLPEDIDGNTIIDMTEMEQIAYRLNGTNLERYSTTTGTTEWQIIAEDIDNLEFQYLDQTGTPTADLDDVYTITVSILARSGRSEPDFNNNQTYSTASGASWTVNDNFRRRFLTRTIHCRNMGL